MPNNAQAILMWEDNPDTPLTANNLSEAINVQSQGKFIHFADTDDDYEKWADYVTRIDWELLNPNSFEYNKLIYHLEDKTVRSVVWNPDQQQNVWNSIHPTPFKKILRISAKTKISTFYVEQDTGEPHTINFDFGEEDQIVTIDDLITQDEDQDFTADTRYLVYLYVKHSYNDTAYVKIIKAADEGLSYWKNDYETPASPTGNNIISYRKIGGFTTDATAAIDEESVWDLSTYKDEIVAGKIKVFENDAPRPLSASDFNVIDNQNLFSSGLELLTVEEALFQSRALINRLNDRFYTNRRFGLNVQFSHVIPSGTTYVQASPNDVTLRLTPGFVDVLGTQVTIEETMYLGHSSVGFKINSGSALVYNARLINEDDESGNVLYPGVWRVFVDFNGVITLRHELAEAGQARWIPQYFGWFDTTGKRCLGKFRVRADSGNYIEKFSVTDTFDVNAATNSIHIHYGTLCPDGLLPCDGKWRDVNGIDSNAYEFDELPAPAEWGERWFEETPDWVHKTIRGADPAFDMITGGPYNIITNAGGADDYTMLGGAEDHKHSFPHSHTPGTLNVLPSGTHPGEHQIDFNGFTPYVEVNTTSGGQKVSKYDHEHNMTVTGGDHSHAKDNFSGMTGTLSGSGADTQSTNSWPPYREAMICIKKV